MLNFIKAIRIRAKLLLAFGSIIVLSILLTLYAISSISIIISLHNLNDQSQQLLINIERIELATKEFIYEGYKQKSFQEKEQSEVLDRYQASFNAANENLRQIRKNELLSDPNTKALVDTLRSSSVNIATFEETKSLLKRRGFKDYGLEGSLRAAIHKIENSGQKYDRVAMLTLRRHEKDFFLRKDLKYQNEFNKTISNFGAELDRQKNKELMSLLANYREEFNQVVDIEKEIGLTDKDGKKGQLFANLQSVRGAVEKIRSYIFEITSNKIAQSKILLGVIFGVQLVIAIALALTYSNALTKVIKEIRTTMSQLAEGVFPSPLIVKTREEIGQTKAAINQFLERLKRATTYAEKLGTGDLNAKYEEQYGGDVLAKALIAMQKKLGEADVIQSRINWTNEGTARFSELLKNDEEDIGSLGDSVLRMLVTHIHANQAALYIINQEEKCFERVSTYAYEKKRREDNKIDLAEGLVGQCAKERETIHLKEVPRNYIKITSGLGAANPRNVIIVPLQNGDEIVGVIEIASLELFKEAHIEFVEKIGANIAAFISKRQSTDKTRKLLEELKYKAEYLSQQEEELRQSSEGLQALHEETRRRCHELENEVLNLKTKLKGYEERFAEPSFN